MWKLLARLRRRRLDQRPTPPEPRRRTRRDPYAPLKHEEASPTQRWLFGIDEPDRRGDPDTDDQ